MKVVIGQSDVVTAYGWGMEALWSGLLSGTTAIRATQRFIDRGFVSCQAALIADLDVDEDESRVMAMLRRLLKPLIGKVDPFMPIILATTVGEIEYLEKAVLGRGGKDAEAARPDALLERIKRLLGLRGEGVVVSSACASSAVAVASAAAIVQRGEVSAALVVACDAVSEFVYSGFSGLLSLSDRPARPFDAQRDGLSLGEAAAWVTVVNGEAPEAAAGSTTEILGWGSTTDAVHMTAPDRNGLGLSRAIGKACRRAQRLPEQVDFIAGHGTGTVFSDAMEMAAFRNVFRQSRPTFSIKGGMGHAMGAAALVQLLVAQEAIVLGIVPPTVGLSVPIPEANGWVANRFLNVAAGGVAISTSSGFGGVNTAILLGGRAEA